MHEDYQIMPVEQKINNKVSIKQMLMLIFELKLPVKFMDAITNRHTCSY